MEQCECKHDGSTWSNVYCKECSKDNCKNCIKNITSVIDKWSKDYNIPLFLEARTELIEYIENLSSK